METTNITSTIEENIKKNIQNLELASNERLDDLEYKSLSVIQYTDWYCFNSDSVLLANIVKSKQNSRIVELGAGCGVISIIIAAKKPHADITAVELQERPFNLLKRNIQLNCLNIKAINSPMQNCHKLIGANCYDIVVVNPPYSEPNQTMISKKDEIAIARHEVAVTMKEVIESSKKLLKYGGKLYIIYKATRLIELMQCMLEHNIVPKTITNIIPTPSKTTDTVVVEATNGGNLAGLVIDNLIVYNCNGEMTDKAKALYSKLH